MYACMYVATVSIYYTYCIQIFDLDVCSGSGQLHNILVINSTSPVNLTLSEKQFHQI